MTTEQQHTPGLIRISLEESRNGCHKVQLSPQDSRSLAIAYAWGLDAQQVRKDAQFIRDSWNAIASAAARLGIPALELAERLADGGIASLIEAITSSQDVLGHHLPPDGINEDQTINGLLAILDHRDLVVLVNQIKGEQT